MKKNNKKKLKSFFKTIFASTMVGLVSLACVGCMGNPPDGNGDDDFNALDMYGTKVLYRPDSYDFSGNTGGTEDQPNDYYGKYAYYIMQALYDNYGVLNKNSNRHFYKYNQDLYDLGTDYYPYLYDSIRYKPESVGNVTKIVTNNNGEISEETGNFVVVSVNENVNWNWTFYKGGGNLTDFKLLPAFYDNAYYANYDEDALRVVSNGISFNLYDVKNDIDDAIKQNYENSSYITEYQKIFYSSSNNEADYKNYSDFTKALEYVVYCYSLDLEPNQISVTSQEAYPYYSLTVSGFNTTTTEDESSSASLALESIKQTFNKTASYVGLSSRQITKIKNWIAENIVGKTALSSPDVFTEYNNVKLVKTINGDSVTYAYDYSGATSTVISGFKRDYRNVIDKIVGGVCNDVKIGGDSSTGEDLTIDNKFLASEITEYAGSTFVIQDDANFPAPENATGTAIKPLEYQSVTLMLNKKTNLDTIWVALKYDADLDGTQEGVFGDKYIEILVELNYYNHAKNQYQTLQSQIAKVYDGAYDIDYMGGGSASAGMPEAPEGHTSGVEFDFNQSVTIDQFNTNIGNGILKTDVGQSNYNGSVLVSQSPLVLVGSTNVRKYYSLLEPAETEQITSGTTYISGKLNPAMFAGTDGCDYVEITYKVLKKKGDTNTNYKFYTGIALVADSNA